MIFEVEEVLETLRLVLRIYHGFVVLKVIHYTHDFALNTHPNLYSLYKLLALCLYVT
jgi:hypothetical protein